MDLRWGIREQSHNDHTIMEFCIREIENCKQTSVGPTFVVSSSLLAICRPSGCTVASGVVVVVDVCNRSQMRTSKYIHV